MIREIFDSLKEEIRERKALFLSELILLVLALLAEIVFILLAVSMINSALL